MKNKKKSAAEKRVAWEKKNKKYLDMLESQPQFRKFRETLGHCPKGQH